MATLSQALAIAIQHHQAGNLQAAEQIYRQILAVEPNHVDAIHLLGVMANQVGRHETAVDYLRRAIELRADVAAFHNNLGEAYRASRRTAEAVACYHRALDLSPNYAEAHSNLGNALKELGEPDQAIASYRRALELKPDFADAHYNLGIALKDQGALDPAIASYRRALELRPDFAAAHNNLGAAFKEQGKLDEAIACYRRVLELRPDFADAHNNLGAAFKEQARLDEAIACYRRALELRPDFPEAHSNLGIALEDQGKPDEAIACYRRALELRPEFVEVHNHLGMVLRDQGKLDEAIACYRRALELRPGYAEAHNNLGNTLKDQGKLDEAIACYRRALELNPGFVEAHTNLGVAFNDRGKLDEAAACYRRALELKPELAEVHLYRSFLSLLSGDFQRGWAEYQWRWKTKVSPPRDFRQPLWDGRPLEGSTILLHAEQGLGDTIQFVRYAALVQQRGGSVIVECPRPLASLLKSCAGIDRLVARGDPLPAFDVQAPLLSLPGIFQTTLDNLPATIPYLFADADLVQRWRQELACLAGLKIGIAWRGSPAHVNDRARSLPLRCFESLARLPGVHLLSLQKGPGVEELQELPSHFPVVELGGRLNDFADTAALLMNLDLLITCDTAVAHLAGALGAPVWVALPLVPDWRWLLDRDDSPWYPTMRLFRQRKLGDWIDVFQEIEPKGAALPWVQ
jgi:tetratricopeptide (TPR) repeat protein